MKAHLINTHLLVLWSKSSAKVKVKYKGYISQNMATSGAFVFHKHILFQELLLFDAFVFNLDQSKILPCGKEFTLFYDGVYQAYRWVSAVLS